MGSTNSGARIEGPSTSWMTLAINKEIGDVKPGASTSVGILFRPPDTLSQAVYDDSVVIYSDNHIPYTYHIQVTVTSSNVGNVLFDVLNEFMEDVPNATITFQHQLLTELIYTVKTGADGTVMKYDIPEGRYTYNISPPAGHLPTSGTFVISPGQTTQVPVALQMKLVDITWSVEPTTIQDKYEIVIHQTFETNVPAPVLITEPASITLPDMQPGQVVNGEFTVTNYGLVAVDNVKLSFPTSFMDYDIEVLTSVIPNRLNAMQKITVPYRITKRLTTGSWLLGTDNLYACSSELQTPNFQLLEEIMGYGGSGCYTSFGIITCGECLICPNTPQQSKAKKCASYWVFMSEECATSTPTGTGSPVIYLPHSPGQTSGNSFPPSEPTAITPGKDCYKIALEHFGSCLIGVNIVLLYGTEPLFVACLCTGPLWLECVGALGLALDAIEIPLVATCGLSAYNVYKDCVGCGSCGLPK